MNADELLASLGGLPGTHTVAAPAPFRSACLVADIEVATAPSADERDLRRIWRERRGGGATPLLLVTDAPQTTDSVVTIGPLDGEGVLHTVATDSLAGVLRRVSALPRLEAVRELTAELERARPDRDPRGTNYTELLTMHTLDVHVRGHSVRWKAAQAAIEGIPDGADWRGVLSGARLLGRTTQAPGLPSRVSAVDRSSLFTASDCSGFRPPR